MDEKTKSKLLAITEVNDAAQVANRQDPKTGKKGRMSAVQKVAYERGLWYLAVRGYSYADIGFVMDQSRQNVQKFMRKAIDNALSNIYAEIEYERRQHYLMYMHIYKEAMRSWEISKEPKQRVTRKQFQLPKDVDDDQRKSIEAQMEDKRLTEVTTVVEPQAAGNNTYLATAMNALKRAEDLIGMNNHMKEEADWHALLTRAGLDAEEVFNITVIEMQGKLGSGISSDGEYDMYADPNVTNMIDAKFTPSDNGKDEDAS